MEGILAQSSRRSCLVQASVGSRKTMWQFPLTKIHENIDTSSSKSSHAAVVVCRGINMVDPNAVCAEGLHKSSI